MYSWTARVEEASKKCYVTAEPLPGQWECDWQEWPGLLYMLGGPKESLVEKFMDRAFGITGRIEALAFIPEAFEYFMFAVDGQYYEFVDFEVYRFDTPFASHDDFLRSIQPMDLRRAASTKLEPRPEFDPHQGYHDDDDGGPFNEDVEWDSEEEEDDDDEALEWDRDEVGTSRRCRHIIIA
ncbi:hypothetical protein C8J57DRAFT_1223586 [Mycena rebaudengoi]|nr:hypothetical protein C8J57DRAFT_1223586 [Mycena rebaudengoi]